MSGDVCSLVSRPSKVMMSALRLLVLAALNLRTRSFSPGSNKGVISDQEKGATAPLELLSNKGAASPGGSISTRTLI